MGKRDTQIKFACTKRWYGSRHSTPPTPHLPRVTRLPWFDDDPWMTSHRRPGACSPWEQVAESSRPDSPGLRIRRDRLRWHEPHDLGSHWPIVGSKYSNYRSPDNRRKIPMVPIFPYAANSALWSGVQCRLDMPRFLPWSMLMSSSEASRTSVLRNTETIPPVYLADPECLPGSTVGS
jgi:hypothetical protein